MQLSFLGSLLDRPGPWATVYFDPARNDESGAERRELSVREACRALKEEGADAATPRAVRDALMSISPAQDPAGRVIDAAGGEGVLSHRLSRPPQRRLACWARLPRLTPLLELPGQAPDRLVAYNDQTGADFELRGAPDPQDAGHVEGQQPVHRTASADWSKRHFQLKAENTWERNAGEIVDELNSAYEESGADMAVLVADPRERPAAHERLPEVVRKATVETERGGRAAGSSSPALEETIDQTWQHDRHPRVEEVLDCFRAGRMGTGRTTDAVEGVPPLGEAAREHRIDTLLIRSDGPEPARETWVGDDPDQVAVRRTDAQTLGESHPTPVRADEALLRSAVATAADVLIVPPSDEDSPGVPGRRPWCPVALDIRTGHRLTRTYTKETRCPHMERGSDPVSPRKDDEMKHELEGHLRSGQPTHAEEAYDPEPPADDDIRVDPSGPVPPPGEEREQARAEAEADFLRRELARHLERTAFPADRQTVLGVLEAHHAPDFVLEVAENLPSTGTYANVNEIVSALGHRPAT